jgi:DNA-binding NarL/FixJ family response regulator
VNVRAVRVMVVSDVRLYREGLSRLLLGYEEVSVVAAECSGRRALLRIESERPDVVLLEADAACETTLVQEIAQLASSTQVVAYGVVDEDRQALRCAEAGAAAFVSSEATGDELVDTILHVARGEFHCSPRVAALLVRRVCALSQGGAARDEEQEQEQDALTPRERGIAALVSEGLSNKEIAVRLGIELCTVKNHVHHILQKVRATRRTELIAQRHRPQLAKDVVPTRSGSGSKGSFGRAWIRTSSPDPK